MCQKFNNQTASLTTQAPSIPAPIPRSIFPARSGIHSVCRSARRASRNWLHWQDLRTPHQCRRSDPPARQCALLPSLAYSQACGCAPARLSAPASPLSCPFHFRPAPRSVPSSAPPAPSAPPPHRSGSARHVFPDSNRNSRYS